MIEERVIEIWPFSFNCSQGVTVWLFLLFYFLLFGERKKTIETKRDKIRARIYRRKEEWRQGRF